MTFSQRTAPKAFPGGRRVSALIPIIFFFLFLLQDCISLLRGHCGSTAGRLSIFSTQTENLGWTDSHKISLVGIECKVQKLVSFDQGLLFPRFFFFWKNSTHTWWTRGKDPMDLRDISCRQRSRVSKEMPHWLPGLCEGDSTNCPLVSIHQIQTDQFDLDFKNNKWKTVH